jgi:ferredoxin
MALKHRLLVDHIVCKGHGLCAELLPERVQLDDWGYPIIDSAPFGSELMVAARRAPMPVHGWRSGSRQTPSAEARSMLSPLHAASSASQTAARRALSRVAIQSMAPAGYPVARLVWPPTWALPY